MSESELTPTQQAARWADSLPGPEARALLQHLAYLYLKYEDESSSVRGSAFKSMGARMRESGL